MSHVRCSLISVAIQGFMLHNTHHRQAPLSAGKAATKYLDERAARNHASSDSGLADVVIEISEVHDIAVANDLRCSHA